jgi:hypothetical protein
MVNPDKFINILNSFEKDHSSPALWVRVNENFVLYEFSRKGELGYYVIDKKSFDSLAAGRFDIKKRDLFWVLTIKNK